MTDVSALAAITAALSQDWKQAVQINTKLLLENKDDVDSLCRLAFAYQQTGKLTLAKTTYQKVLELDEYHQIALKNLKKLTTLKSRDVSHTSKTTISPILFLEEPGKTKIVECVHLAPAQVLSTLTSGQEVYLKAKNHCVELRDDRNRYVAALPDDLSFKLLKFLAGGNAYHALIKGVEKKSLKVFLREVSRGKKFATQPSFTPSFAYVPMVKDQTAKEPAETEEGEAEENEET
ncbi:MAG: TPR domain protein [Candidatus Gottesmanbacteria bacterium GW2011_GWA2_47_9]|uniref:TPR domain protein n=2 Tax=Candidatus Gottesmaniibacteriota TaxID=1752720 RepID=A0A0G1UN03_9BACT|nr:MAG: TPR domain protein [Candidatus Gottesmanbacteria bacterium GW2011_GWA2_47_9]KKU95481.1 MAG: TPR domain protein [Candidatus Gottesmanbacteria bacterium GW2011_GWA1_48_13]